MSPRTEIPTKSLTSTSAVELTADELALRLPYEFPASSDCFAPLAEVAGQARAQDALRFGLAMAGDGYNVAISGPPQSGRSTIASVHVAEAASAREVGLDWCYLYNFLEPRRPRAVALPAGRADALATSLQEFIRVCKEDLPRAFDAEAYAVKAEQTLAPFNADRERALTELDRRVRAAGLLLNSTPIGLSTVPAHPDGTPMDPAEFNAMPPESRRQIEAAMSAAQDGIEAVARTIRRLEVGAADALSNVDAEITRFVLNSVLSQLRTEFPSKDLETHFAALEADVLANLRIFKGFADGIAAGQPPAMLAEAAAVRAALLRRYEANVFVRQDPARRSAPVHEERHPTFHNLFGRVEFENQMGNIVTDFMHLRPGAIHLANGGFLTLHLQDVLEDPRSWGALKAALKNREARFAEAGPALLPFPMVELLPETIPLDLKVVLIGEPRLFALVEALDEEFGVLFKVRAELEPDISLDPTSLEAYGRFVCRVQRESGSLPFDRSALQELARYGARLAGRRDRLTARYGAVGDLCLESAHLARLGGGSMVTSEEVLGAQRARATRSSLVADRLRRLIAEGTLHVQTSGTAIGQVNGLAVYQTGNFAFGTPMRITCRVGSGRLGVVAIERETERSGAIHTKGVLVLSGFLAGTFGRSLPLTFNASLTFEQSYDEVEGDSASSAELYAILTALADVPVRQSIAVTGSIDQFGNVQAVGGVAEKVEGFFDVCSAVGLDGQQGVIVPSANVRNLTLRPDVVAAVEADRFHIWAVSRVEQGVELLTGITAGERDARGCFPAGSVFARVEHELRQLMSVSEPRTGLPGTE